MAWHRKAPKQDAEKALVSLVHLVCLVCFIGPDQPDQPDRPETKRTTLWRILIKMMCVGDTSARESVANPGGQYSESTVLVLRWAMAFRITGFGK